jgi:predicted XRE-type DNA-binding protein
MGLPNSEERLAKAKLAAIINRIIEEKGLTQNEAAKILGINQPKISALRNGRLNGFSIERLFRFLELLGQHIEITITHKSKTKVKTKVKTKARQGINVSYV